MTTRLEEHESQDRDKPNEATEEGDLTAVEPLPEELDERAHGREQQTAGHHQQDGLDRERQCPRAARGGRSPGWPQKT